jgi:menaquinone-dependent protoporphyrinogen oxidase
VVQVATILVAYGSGEGQTGRVAGRIAAVLSGRGHAVTVVDVAERPAVGVRAFDAVLVGSPVRNRRHLPSVRRFVDRNRETLADRPSGFFQLSLASLAPGRWAEEGAHGFVDDLVERTGWRPDRLGLFAGAVRYTQYDRLTRLAFRLVSAVTTGDTDTARDYEYTDWDDVEAFAAEFASLVERSRVATGDSAGGGAAGRDRRRAAALLLLGVGLATIAYRLLAGAGRPPGGVAGGGW